MLHQQLSKEWFLVRNALSNFTSDAMLNHVRAVDGVIDYDGCNAYVPSSSNFASDVNSYWDQVTNYSNLRFSTNCDVNLSGGIELQMEGPSLTIEELRSNERAYGLLSCSRATNNASLTITRPFVVRKLVEKDYPSPGQCRISVYDILGTNDNPALKYSHRKLDVNATFV